MQQTLTGLFTEAAQGPEERAGRGGVQDGDDIPSRFLNRLGHHVRAVVGGYDNVELVPLHEVARYASQETSPERAKEVGTRIAETGSMEPLILHYHPKTGEAYLGEGNHRLRAARALGMNHVPVRVSRAAYGLGGPGVPTPQPHPAQDAGGHVPADIRPSDLGLTAKPPESRTATAFFRTANDSTHPGPSPEDYAPREGEDRWDQSFMDRVRRGLSLGHLTYAQAYAHGYGGDDQERPGAGRKGWQPLPHTLYHTTTDAAGVMEHGLKSASELGQDRGHGLGSAERWLSLTDSADQAHNTLRTLHEYHDHLTGKTSLPDLMRAAESGEGAERPYADTFRRSFSLNEHGMHSRLREKHMEPGFRMQSEADAEGLTPHPTAHSRFETGTGDSAGMGWERDMTEREKLKGRHEAYRSFAHSRSYAGGPPSFPFLGNNHEAFSAKDPSNFAVLKVRPKPGAQGFFHSDVEHEWRTGTGDAVEVHGEPLHRTSARTSARTGPSPEDYAPREGEDQWDQSFTDRVRRGLSLGHLTYAQARAHGYPGGGAEDTSHDGWGPPPTKPKGWQPLPHTLYHTTTDAAGVMAHGLKTGAELGQQRGHGLGGTPDWLSLTDSAEGAHNMLHALHEYHAHLNGKTSLADLHRAAESGEGAERPYHKGIRDTWGSENEHAIASRMRGKRLEPGFATHDEAAEKGWTPHPTVHRAVEGDGIKAGTGWERDANIEDRHDEYGAFSRARKWAGGRPSVLFLSNDRKAFAAKDPSNFAVLKLHPKPGAHGIISGDKNEWRTGTGDAVEVHGEPLRRTSAQGRSITSSAPTPGDKAPPEVHRGVALVLSPEKHRMVHDPAQPLPARAHLLLSEVRKRKASIDAEEMHGGTGGLGEFWAPSDHKAEEFANQGGFRAYREHEREHNCGDEYDGNDGCPTTYVVMHAHEPDPKHHWHEIHRPGERYDRELSWRLPVRPGAPLSVSGVSWAEGDDQKSWSERKMGQHEFQRYDFAAPVEKHAGAPYTRRHDWLPSGKYWGPNSAQVDQRLFDGDRLRPEIREDVLRRVGAFFDGHGYKDWIKWTRVYFAGSQAAKWLGPDGKGNGDFDVLLGIHWPVFRRLNPQCAAENDLQVTTAMTDGFWHEVNSDGYSFTLRDGRRVGPFSTTFFVNATAWDITTIHPYAAYDVTEDAWAVSPLKVPADWSAEGLPESYWDYAESVAKEVDAIGELPPEERARMARNLWEEIHTHRSDAFADGGKGLFDLSNVLEKYLDQNPSKPWDRLREWKRGAPVAGVATLTSIFREAAVRMDIRDTDTGADHDGVMIALVPPKAVCESLAVDGGEPVDAMHVTLAYLGGKGEHGPEALSALPGLVRSWAATQRPLTANVGGVGTFVNPSQHVLWAAVDLPRGTVFRDSLVGLLEEHGYKVGHDHGWVPHLTLSYSQSHFRFMPKVEPASWDVTEVWCCVGGRWESFPIGG